jgi:protochlorophyllide reductase
MAQRWTQADIGDLQGRTALITGANSGLGFETARHLAGHGAQVLMACRNAEKAEAAASALRAEDVSGSVEICALDLASIASIDALVASIVSSGRKIDVLINNAGLMAVDEQRTVDGFEMQFGVNHLGHFVLTAGLMPLLLETPGSRVVSVSSMGHRAGKMHFDDLMYERGRYKRWPAYFQSKLSNLLFTAELQRRLGTDAPTSALTAHPGGSRTDLGTEGSGFTNWAMRKIVPLTTQPASRGALPIVRAAIDPAAKGGEFYGPHRMASGYPVLETPSKRARNADDARRLWDISEQLTGRTIDTTPSA